MTDLFHLWRCFSVTPENSCFHFSLNNDCHYSFPDDKCFLILTSQSCPLFLTGYQLITTISWDNCCLFVFFQTTTVLYFSPGNNYYFSIDKPFYLFLLRRDIFKFSPENCSFSFLPRQRLFLFLADNIYGHERYKKHMSGEQFMKIYYLGSSFMNRNRKTFVGWGEEMKTADIWEKKTVGFWGEIKQTSGLGRNCNYDYYNN